LREADWNGRGVRIGGIGGVVTREDGRHCGIASTVMRRAMQELADTHEVDFGLLFCEPRHAPVYEKLGWRRFAGEVFALQPHGRLHARSRAGAPRPHARSVRPALVNLSAWAQAA